MVPLRNSDSLRQVEMNVVAYRALREAGDFFSPHFFILEGATAKGNTFSRHLGVPPDMVEDPFTGSATGGMGAYSPTPIATASIMSDVERTILVPIVDALNNSGAPYRGVHYAGLMLTPGGPKVLEFNCRFGDPEAQVLLPLLDSDPIDVMLACAEGRLAKVDVKWRTQAQVGVVITSGGYPGSYETGFEIHGFAEEQVDTQVFHAGTRQLTGGELDGRKTEEAKVVTSGGRVLTVTGWGDTLEEARNKAYRRVDTISFEGAYHRRDIGTPRDLNPTLNSEERWPVIRTS